MNPRAGPVRISLKIAAIFRIALEMRSIVLFIANVFGIAWGLYLHVQFLAPQLLPLSHQARPRANTIHSLLVRLELVNPYVALVGEEPSLCIE